MSGISVIRKGLDKLTLNLNVSNTGNVSIDTDVKVRVSNLLNKEIITFGGEYPIFRNDTAAYNYDIKSPTFGSIYKAKGIITYDGNAAAVIGETGSRNPITIETRPIYFLVFPTLKGLAIILSSIFFFIFLLLKTLIKRKRQKWIMKNWAQYKARKGDDINSLSDKFSVNWKILAKTNKLKAPYIIKSGDVLKVPPKMVGNGKLAAKNTKKSSKETIEIKTPRKVTPKNNVKEKPKLKNNPTVKAKTKPKTFTKPKSSINKEPPAEPQVDEISSIV